MGVRQILFGWPGKLLGLVGVDSNILGRPVWRNIGNSVLGLVKTSGINTGNVEIRQPFGANLEQSPQLFLPFFVRIGHQLADSFLGPDKIFLHDHYLAEVCPVLDIIRGQPDGFALGNAGSRQIAGQSQGGGQLMMRFGALGRQFDNSVVNLGGKIIVTIFHATTGLFPQHLGVFQR